MAEKTRKKISRKMVCIICGILVIIVVLTSLIFAFSKKETNEVLQATKSTANAVNLENNEHMHVEEDASEDKVPVPNGYVGSKVAGENEIDTGYVIYEGEEEVNDSNVEEAQKTRNQYVWIPVPDATTMYGTDENGKKWGKLYDFTAETGEGINPMTGTKPLNWIESDGIMNIMSERNYREPAILTTVDDEDSDLKTNLLKEKNKNDLQSELEKQFNNLIKSIEKYKGFYVGRYETGDLSKERVVVRKGNNNIASQNWYSMYKKCRKLKNSNINVETSMIFGCQYDRILMWLIESGNKTKEQICVDSTSWGNYSKTTFKYTMIDGNTATKSSDRDIIIPTGSTEYTKANNIYDLAGNVVDETLEAKYGNRVLRGSRYFDDGQTRPSSLRWEYYGPNLARFDFGCRAILYIK